MARSESLKRGFVFAWSAGDGEEPWGCWLEGDGSPKCLVVGLLGVEEVLLGHGGGGELPDSPGCRAHLGVGVGDAQGNIRVPGLRERNFYSYLQQGAA